jgi:flavin reductase (DIM6/NTAB) family NADH-FMN oxidoreductase RutF
LLLSGVAPRPIALVATLSKDGIPNLAPYSFFNAYASNPPIVAIGPAIAAATGKVKDTYTNIVETGECTINAVTFAMTEQISLASCDFSPEVDEFVKSGLNPLQSAIVRPARVQESPFQMECKLIESIPLMRERGGNGNIMLLEVVKLHVNEAMFINDRVDPQRLDLVARMGYDYYCRAHGDAIFEVFKPIFIRESPLLTGAQLAKLAGVKEIPEKNEELKASALLECSQISELGKNLQIQPNSTQLENIVSVLTDADRVDLAWRLLVEFGM